MSKSAILDPSPKRRRSLRNRWVGGLVAATMMIAGLCAVEPAQAGVISAIDIAPVWSVHETGAPVLLSTSSFQYIAYYDVDEYLTVARRDYSSTAWTYRKFTDIRSNWQTGAHHAIAMQIDSAGRIHITAAMHAEALKYYQMTGANDMTSFVKVSSLVGGIDEQHISYPEFFKDSSGGLFLSYRSGGSGNGSQITDKFNASTGAWTRLPTILDGTATSESAYIRGPLLGPDGYFHLVWMWRQTGDVATNHLMNYARSMDLINWKTASGAALTLPMTPSTSATTFDPVPTNGGLINSQDFIGFDSSGRAVIDYVKYDANGNTQLYNARYTSGAWQIVSATDWKWRWPLSGAGAISPDVNITPPSVEAPGSLGMDFDHKMYGIGRIVVNETTLQSSQLLTQDETPHLWPRVLDSPETVNPPRPMTVSWVKDLGSPPSGQEFVMRWEHGPSNGDVAVAQPWPSPTMLRIYSLNPSTERATTNFALGKTVAASSSYETSAWGSSNLTDGKLFPSAATAGYSSNSVLTSNHPESVTVDLGTAQAISQVSLLPATPGGEGMPIDFSLQTSTDSTTWANVVSRTNAPLTAGEQTFAFPTVTARYVRLNATSLRQIASDGNKYRLQLNEMLVSGAPNLAVSAMPTATSSYETSAWSLSRINDGDTNPINNGWTSVNQLTANHSESVTLDIGASKQVGSVELFPAGGGDFFPLHVVVEVSTSGSNWVQVVSAPNVPIPTTSAKYTFSGQSARYVRVTGSSLRQWSGDKNQYRMQLSEIRVTP